MILKVLYFKTLTLKSFQLPQPLLEFLSRSFTKYFVVSQNRALSEKQFVENFVSSKIFPDKIVSNLILDHKFLVKSDIQHGGINLVIKVI